MFYKPKVSVIVPIYNTEKYLAQCIESLLNQTLKNIEIILVNDGSTDSSLIICEYYAKKNKKIRIIDKQNGGYGAACNAGINAARGEYIGLVESDDFADIHMFEDLYKLAKKSDVDIVKSSWFNYWGETNTKEKDMRLAGYNSYEILNMLNSSFLLRIQPTVWSAVYKKTFLNKYNIRFLETPGASYQDTSFTFKVFGLAKSIAITPNAYIHYRCDNDNSSVHSKEKVNYILYEYEEVNKLFNEYPELKQVANTDKLLKQYNDYLWNYNRIADCYKKEFLEVFSNQFIEYKNQGELDDRFFNNIDVSWFNANILNG